MQTQSLEGGFAEPPLDSARAFRGVMEALARPGTIHTLAGAAPPPSLSVAAGVAVLTLCDTETPIHLAGATDCTAVRDWIAFHTGAPFAAPSECMFALGAWADLSPLSAFPVGTPEYPDRSATLIVEVTALSQDGPALTGPGIRDTAHLSLPDTTAFQDNAALFPLGLDFLFTCGAHIAALPRSTKVV